MVDILNLGTLLAQMVLALGAALVFGNGAAIWMDRTGRTPKKATGEFRRPRAWWLFVVGLLMTLWGGASLLVG